MKKLSFVLSCVIAAFIASIGINATTAPYNMYVEPGTYSCLVRWDDDENSSWNLRYRLFTDEPDEPVLLHSLSGSAYTGNYADITLPAPWGGVNLRGGNGAVYFKNKSTGYSTNGSLTYTIPEGYTNATFKLLITSGTGTYGSGNFTVSTPQTAAVGHNFTGGETYEWLVTASSGEKITVTSTDANYSPDIALIGVYYVPTIEWIYANDLIKKYYRINDLEPETDYEVQVQAIGSDGTLSDWTRPDVFTTLAEGEEPIIPTVHILGDVDTQVWSPFAGTKMEYNPGSELYTATIHVEAGHTFGFTLEIDDNEDMGGWNYIEPYRFGPESDTLFLLKDEYLGQALTMSFENRADIQAVKSGDYEVTVSLELKYIKIGMLVSTLRGDVDGNGEVAIADVTALINYLLTGDDSNVVLANADVNLDEEIDIADVTTLLNFLLTGNW